MKNKFSRFFKRVKTLRPHQNKIDDSIDVTEMQVTMAQHLMDDLLKERRTERKWKWIKRFVFSSISAVLFIVYLFFYATNLGYKAMPSSDIVGIIHIDGEISDKGNASSEMIIPSLQKAFDQPNVKAIVLQINSPGGLPAESERINKFIDMKKAETKKPVYAVITNLGASAAYLIAIHADKIHAGKFSMVGSIGAIMSGWDFHNVLDKVQVDQRVFASGDLKHMMNPYSTMSEKEAQKAQRLVNNIADDFFADVKKQRGKKLKDDLNYLTGEVWTGQESVDIGLVDAISTLEDTVSQIGDYKTFDFGPTPPKNNFFSSFLTQSFDLDIFNKLNTFSLK